MTRVTMWCLLAVVADAAAILSFASLRDLALLCGFSRGLAWLLPVVIDAGAAAGCLVWLGGASGLTGGTGTARRFARGLTTLLLASSVAGNAIVHGLSAYHQPPPWWLVVAVSAVAPAVLGAVVHLAVLVGRPRVDVELSTAVSGGVDATNGDAVAGVSRSTQVQLPEGLGRRRLAAELGVTEHKARQLLATRNGAVQ